MDENKKLEDFSAFVKGGIELVRPWKWALIVTNVCWAFVLGLFIWLAYMSPDTSYQYQDFDGHIQTQADGQYDPSMGPGGDG